MKTYSVSVHKFLLSLAGSQASRDLISSETRYFLSAWAILPTLDPNDIYQLVHLREVKAMKYACDR